MKNHSVVIQTFNENEQLIHEKVLKEEVKLNENFKSEILKKRASILIITKNAEN